MTSTCHGIRELLHDRLDGRSSAAESARIENHLEGCAACRADAVGLEALRAEAARLPKEVEPARELWSGVELRLGSSGWRRRHSSAAPRTAIWRSAPLIAAAAAIAALGLGLWLGRGAPVSMDFDAVRADLISEEDGNHARAELARSEDGMLLAHQDLLTAVQSQSDRLSPETVAAVEENMRIIDQAIGQIRTALEEDPLDQRLNMLLAAQYQHEVELLKRVSGV